MALRTLPVWLSLVVSPGCSMLGSFDELMPVQARIDGGEVDFHDRACCDGDLRGVLLGSTTHFHSVRLKWRDREFELKGSPLWWNQWFVGPLLPVIPVLMGAGVAQPHGRFSIALLSGDPVRLPVARMTAVPHASWDSTTNPEPLSEPVAATGVVLEPLASARQDNSSSASATTIAPGDDAVLTPGSRATIDWPFDNYRTDGFTVTFTLLADRDGQAEETTCVVRFEHEHAVFLAFCWPIPF